MNIKIPVISLCFTVLSFTSISSYALPSVGATDIELKKNCAAGNDNCFVDTAELIDWLWTTRNPSADSPVSVKIGAGTFILPNQAFCENKGFVSFSGSGRENTVLTGGEYTTKKPDTASGGGTPVMFIENCQDLTFQDLTIRSGVRQGTGYGSSILGVEWIGGGKSTWTNVLIEAINYAWWDTSIGTCTSPGEHYFFSSKLESKGAAYNFTYFSQCGESWLYGSEITAIADGIGGQIALSGLRADGNGDVRLFGSVVRAVSTPNDSSPSHLDFHMAIWSNGGTVHMHGGIIVATSGNPNIDRSVNGVVSNGSNAVLHTLETAFNLKSSGAGVARRTVETNGAEIESSFNWAASTNPPQSANKDIVSVNGQDMFVETDCSSASCNDNSQGTETHLLIYNDSCQNSGPWFDVVTGRCRGL